MNWKKWFKDLQSRIKREIQEVVNLQGLIIKELARLSYETMEAKKDDWERSDISDVICYRGFWQDSGLSKDDFLDIMKEVAGVK